MRHLSLLFAGLAVLPGCRSRVPDAPAPVAEPVTQAVDSSEILARQRDSLAQLDAERRREAAQHLQSHLALRDTLAMQVHFDFDRADLRAEDRLLLDRKLVILRHNPDLRLQIAGHCDERGSDEYNLALGTRRATAVRTYLMGHGIDGDRLTTVSFGEERPLYHRPDDWARALNRRGEFELVALPDTLRVPTP